MNRLYIKKFHIKPEPNGSYIWDLPVVHGLSQLDSFEFCKPVTFFVGENGSGKSTLLEALAVRLGMNAEGGSKNLNFTTKSTESDLFHHIFISKEDYERDRYFLRAESFYNVASALDDLDAEPAAAPPLKGAYGGKSLHEQSHGESFMSLVQNRLNGGGLYIFDEPEAALSPTRQMSLLIEIDRLVANNSQFIIATHSPILMAYPDADIYEIKEDTIKLTKYQDTSHHQITKEFLNNPERMLKLLLD